MKKHFDIFIIGGGINGCGIARDASGRGYSVGLVEMGDLSSGTSSWSTKLIHGGLRYMEQYKFNLVRNSLLEREKLLQIAPHIIRPMRFILPHDPKLRPAWLIRLGLFFYDMIVWNGILPKSKKINFKNDLTGIPLKESFEKGFEYSDCLVDDARLVILNARDAKRNGSSIMTYRKAIAINKIGKHWEITTKSKNGNKINIKTFTSKILINAAGPWVTELLKEISSFDKQKSNIRLIKGSHIILPRIYNHDKAYIFQNKDNRIIFTIPFESKFSLVGTTDVDFNGDPSKAKISKEEINYLCNAVSVFFKSKFLPKDVIWNYSGVRPLFDDGNSSAQEITRDYKIETDTNSGDNLINIFGGKITTYRKLSEEVLKIVNKKLKVNNSNWTSSVSLPGGDFNPLKFDSLLYKYKTKYSFFPEKVIERLFKLYGIEIDQMLNQKKSIKSLGKNFGNGLFEFEVKWLIQNEWAKTSEDILWRRTKLGLFFKKKQTQILDEWIRKNYIYFHV